MGSEKELSADSSPPCSSIPRAACTSSRLPWWLPRLAASILERRLRSLPSLESGFERWLVLVSLSLLERHAVMIVGEA